MSEKMMKKDSFMLIRLEEMNLILTSRRWTQALKHIMIFHFPKIKIRNTHGSRLSHMMMR